MNNNKYGEGTPNTAVDQLDLKRQNTSYDINDNGTNLFDLDNQSFADGLSVTAPQEETKKIPKNISFTKKGTGLKKRFRCYDESKLSFLDTKMKGNNGLFLKKEVWANTLR